MPGELALRGAQVLPGAQLLLLWQAVQALLFLVLSLSGSTQQVIRFDQGTADLLQLRANCPIPPTTRDR